MVAFIVVLQESCSLIAVVLGNSLAIQYRVHAGICKA
jgi:hypothetical protein